MSNMEEREKLFINKFESNNYYISRKGFEELCDEFGFDYKKGEKIAFSRGGNILSGGAKPNDLTHSILEQNGEKLDYYNGL